MTKNSLEVDLRCDAGKKTEMPAFWVENYKYK